MVQQEVSKSQEIILDSITDGVFTVDMNWRITSFNRAAERITGVPRDQAIGQRCSEVFRASICENACALRQTLDSGQPLVNRVAYILAADGKRVPISISTAILRDADGNVIGGVETFRDLSEVEQLRKELEHRYSFADIIGRSRAMQKLFELLPTVAESDSTILIEGESGTGKELVARAIHDLSPRRDKPFVAVNCGALPDTLLESELFGYKAGAFTDARRDKPGRFALAEGGTIFLDEIGDVSAAMQSRLLRVLQERVYEPLGSVKSMRADVRVLTATNQQLDAQVKAGAFRQDLYYRVNVIRLPLPPLRDRREDIPLLVDHFVARFNQLQGKDVHGLADEALAWLMAHDFPGNVRELENLIERAFALCRCGIIEARHLPPELREGPVPADAGDDAKASLRELERRLMTQALEHHGGNRSAAARELSMHPSTFYRKAKALGLILPQGDGRHAKSES
jgi:PAS domain S-box-containing protein